MLKIILFSILGNLFLGIPGALLGAGLAIWLLFLQPKFVFHQSYSFHNKSQTQTAFFRATFIVMGRLAKADGRVNEKEIRVAVSAMDDMNMSVEQRQQAIEFFNLGKQSNTNINEVLVEFARVVVDPSLVQIFIELQLKAAYADGSLSTVEMNVLKEICGYLGISNLAFNIIHQRFLAQQAFYGRNFEQSHSSYNRGSGPSLKEAYNTLGVKPENTDKEVKHAYRKLMSEHHPDKLVAKGLPESMMEMAHKKTKEIQAAYDLINNYRKKKSR